MCVCVCALLHYKQLRMCTMNEFSTENDIVGVAVIDSLWFIDSMRAFTLNSPCSLLLCSADMTIYFRLITVAVAAETIQCSVPV